MSIVLNFYLSDSVLVETKPIEDFKMAWQIALSVVHSFCINLKHYARLSTTGTKQLNLSIYKPNNELFFTMVAA